MKHYSILLALLLLTLGTQAQDRRLAQAKANAAPLSLNMKLLRQNGKVGLEFQLENGQPHKRLDPVYDELAAYTLLRVGGISLGNQFKPSRYWNDTEYIEVPIDPNNLSRTRTDTFITDVFAYIANTPVQVKKSGKWGLVDTDGKELLPCAYDDILSLRADNWYGLDPQDYPLMLFYAGTQTRLVNARGEPVLAEEQFPQWYQPLSKQRKGDALEFAFFGTYMLMNEGGALKDTVIKSGGVKMTVYKFTGGTFNVLDLKTGKPLWERNARNIEISFLDPDGKPYYESLNPRSHKSISKFEENFRLGIRPAQVRFEPKD